MKKIAIFGGTFNPIHNGHINLIRGFDARLHFDHILLIPSHMPPHKEAPDLIPGEERCAMCRLACQEDPRFETLSLELQRKGPSYTVETLRQLRERYPGDKLYLIVGSDMFLSITTWYQYQEILKMATLCAAPRDRDQLDELYRWQLRLDEIKAKSVVCDIPLLPISSTLIRGKLARGEDVADLLPPAVLGYIREHRLYQGPPAQERYARYEAALREALSPARYEHSLLVARRAAELARRHGVSTDGATTAGLLHDLCKELPHEAQRAILRQAGLALDPALESQPQVWHGFAASIEITRRFGITDPDVLAAVRYHTVARAGMSPLEKVVYLADLTSLDRDYPDVARLRELADRDLDAAMGYALQYTVEELARRGNSPCADTRAAAAQYIRPAAGSV